MNLMPVLSLAPRNTRLSSCESTSPLTGKNCKKQRKKLPSKVVFDMVVMPIASAAILAIAKSKASTCKRNTYVVEVDLVLQGSTLDAEDVGIACQITNSFGDGCGYVKDVNVAVGRSKLKHEKRRLSLPDIALTIHWQAANDGKRKLYVNC